MTKTKTTPHGGSSLHQPRGMATATLTSTEGEPEQQLKGATGEDTEDSKDFPDVLEDTKKKGDNLGTSKSEGKTGDQPKQAEGGAEAPPKENPPPPPIDPQPSTSKDPTDAPAEVPTQDPIQEAEEEVFICIKDKSGKCISEDKFAMYVEQEDQPKKPRYKLDDEANEAMRDYYDAVHTLSEAQTNFTASAKVLEQKIKDKSVFLDIIRQVQLPAVQISVRTIEEEEKLQG